jgi:hypothetical protein
MSQIGCKVATAAPVKEEQDKEKQPLKIRCLLFFDGTLNNRDNIHERMRHEQGRNSAIYLKNRANQDKEATLEAGALGVDLEDDSYENDFSNIVHLEGNVAPAQNGYDETVVTYIEGAGTIEYTPDYERDKDGNFVLDEYGNKKEIIGNNKDQQSGFAFAAGESGIKPKVDKGIEKAIAKIVSGPDEKNPRDNTKFFIQKLTIDIFGFSRGAASARYCAHRLLKAMDTGDRIEPYIEYRLRAMHWLEVKELEIRFVGLFDTVVSYKAAQAVKFGGSLENFLVKQTAIRHEKVKRVVHLASAEEHRDQFCLHNIKSAGGKGEEYFLPGVHSDIGGGYLDNGSEAGLKVCQATQYWASKDRDEYLLALGWYKPEQLAEDALLWDDAGNPYHLELSVLRDKLRARTVRNAYSRIPLKIMAEKAAEDGIEFRSELDSHAAQAINAFPELTKLESRIKAYMGKVGKRGSKPEDWQMAEPELNAVRHKHLHFSARYNGKYNGLGHNPRRSFFSQKRKRYTFNG